MDAHHDPTDCPASRMSILIYRLKRLVSKLPPERQAALVESLTNGHLQPIDLHDEEENDPPTTGETIRPSRRDRQRGASR